MNTFATTLTKLIASCVLLVFTAHTVSAQTISPPEDPNDLKDLPLVFNMDTDDVDWEEDYTFFPFEGAALERIENPHKSGGNTTDYVLKYVKAGGQPWAGFFYHTDEPIELTDDSRFTLNVWSPRANINALFKLEMREFTDVNTGDIVVNIPVANQWVTLEWDLSVNEDWRDTPFDRLVVIMDLPGGGSGDGSDNFIWYLDDFAYVAEAGTEILPPDNPDDLQDFPHVFNMDTEDIDWRGYTMFPFAGSGLARIPNPHKTGANTTDYVLRYGKFEGDPWAGFFYHTEEPMLLTDDSRFTLNVWSPRADISAVFKLERQTGGSTGDIVVNVPVANEWTTLEWDLSNEAWRGTPWDRAVIIMDIPGGSGDGSDDFIWFLDDFAYLAHPVSNENSGERFLASLHQNYPNPVNSATSITFSMSSPGHAVVEVFDVLGRRVATLVDDTLLAGRHETSFVASDLPTGTYFYRLTTENQVRTRKLTVIN
jgi:hypothetical protein